MVTVAVSGELDPAGVPVLDRTVQKALAARPSRLTIDLTAVTFCGSAGLRAVVVLHAAAEEAGSYLAVRPSAAIRRLLAITCLDSAFPVRQRVRVLRGDAPRKYPAPPGQAEQHPECGRNPRRVRGGGNPAAQHPAITRQPRSDLVKGQVDPDADGYLLTMTGTPTDLDGEFTAGDLVDHTYRQAITATRTACQAALHAERYPTGREPA